MFLHFHGVLAQLARASALQAEGHEFDSCRLHNRVMVYTEKLYPSIQSEGWCDEVMKYLW